MRFFIRRSSDYGNEKKPCEEAIEGTFINAKGNKRKAWFIEIETLEQLMALYHKYGKLVVLPHYSTGSPMLEIYDD